MDELSLVEHAALWGSALLLATLGAVRLGVTALAVYLCAVGWLYTVPTADALDSLSPEGFALLLGAIAVIETVVEAVWARAGALLAWFRVPLASAAAGMLLLDELTIAAGVAVVAFGLAWLCRGLGLRLVDGSVRAGGSRAIVSLYVTVVAALLAAAGAGLAGLGAVIAAGCVVAALRARRSRDERYRGLRVLS